MNQPPSPPRTLSGRGLLVARILLLVPALLLLGALEYGARRFFGKVQPPQPPAYHLDEQSGVRLNANESRTYTRALEHGGQQIPWATNANGLRGPALMNAPAYRIVVVGDSNIQAPFSALENTYPMVLQTLLAAGTGQRVEVVNAGTVGAGPDQHLARMQTDVALLHPNIVILHVFCDNDLGDLIRNALYATDAGGNLVRTARTFQDDPVFVMPTHFPLALLDVAAHLGKKVTARLQRNASKDPQTPAQAIAQHLQTCAQEFEQYRQVVAGKNVPLPGVFADHYDFDLALHPDLESGRAKAALMDGVVGRAKQIAAANGFDLVLLIQPSAQDLTDNLPLTPGMLAAASPDYQPQRLTNLVQAAAERHKVAFINLFPHFSGRAGPLYFRWSDNHWNDEGQKEAAEVTARFLLEHNLRDLNPQATP